uniref:Metallo-beta-lactamase domain-containing protein n=3 Tax=Toxoplasma gondii TaxID=5811 RepID=A0A2T6IL12_TOXGO|nr:metallo-beta-lactamase domain-containing protein [Toxoplasma gondii TgCATBr9]
MKEPPFRATAAPSRSQRPPGSRDANQASFPPTGDTSTSRPPRTSPPASSSSFASSSSSSPPASSSSFLEKRRRMLHITVLGAGQDVGRSAVYVRLGRRCVLFDCGCHLGMKDARRFPLFDKLAALAVEREEEKREFEARDAAEPFHGGASDRLRKRLRGGDDAAALDAQRGGRESCEEPRPSPTSAADPAPATGTSSVDRDDGASLSRERSASVHRHSSLPRSSPSSSLSSLPSSLSLEALLRQPRGILTHAVDACVVSHFHLDHCGALPTLTEFLQ